MTPRSRPGCGRRPALFPHRLAAPLALCAAALLAGCAGAPPATTPAQVHARLPGAVGGITTLPDGRLVINYHPFYDPAEKVGLLNATRDGTTPYPDAQWQTCQRPDGTRKDPLTCLNWVLGLHTDANGILWLLDSGQAEPRITPKLVGWDTRAHALHRVIPIPAPASLPESQHNDFAVDLRRQVIVIADEGIATTPRGDKAALVVVDLATGRSRRVLQGHDSVLPDFTRPITVDQGLPTARSIPVFVGVDGIALDKNAEWLYYAPLNKAHVYRVRMDDLLDERLDTAQLGARVQTYAAKPNTGGLSIDTAGNLYLTEVGERAVGVIPADTRTYRRLASDPGMVWPDGVVYAQDGYLYTGAAQLPLAAPLNGGKAENAPPYLLYRIKPLAPGIPGF
ncbi:major royal jelly family protein [Acidovorax sp. NCPPB 2350]|nr:major royal jelly family protein [Acidovorax sp. NCPPB 2350]